MSTANFTDRLLQAPLDQAPLLIREQLDKMSRSEDDDERLYAARNKNTSAETFHRLANDPLHLVRLTLTWNPALPAEIAKKLCSDENLTVLESIGINRNTPPESLQQLTLSDRWEPSSGVARNPNAPIDLLEKLAKSTVHWITSNLANNPSCPAHILEKLSKCQREDVLMAVASNPNTPSSVLEQLSDFHDVQVLGALAQNINTSASVLQQLAIAPNSLVRSHVASNRTTLAETLKNLSTDKVLVVRMRVAANPNTPAETLEALSRDKELLVRNVVPLAYSSAFEKLGIDNIDALIECGYQPEGLYGLHKPKQLCKTLIGTAHPEEMKMLFSDKDFHTLTVLSVLQSAFINPVKHKLDRDGYLRFVALLNQTGNASWISRLNAAQVQHAMRVIGQVGLAIVHATCSEPADTISMLCDCSMTDNPKEMTRQIALIRRWINKHQRLDTHFHDYLINKSIRDNKLGLSEMDFPQAQLQVKVDALNMKLRHQAWQIFLPHNSTELLILGTRQRHCVAGRHYQDQLTNGNAHIFSLAPIEQGIANLKKGFTCHYDASGKRVQARKYRNKEVDANLAAWGDSLYQQLMKECRTNLD